jgi:hypothetical protein
MRNTTIQDSNDRYHLLSLSHVCYVVRWWSYHASHCRTRWRRVLLRGICSSGGQLNLGIPY